MTSPLPAELRVLLEKAQLNNVKAAESAATKLFHTAADHKYAQHIVNLLLAADDLLTSPHSVVRQQYVCLAAMVCLRQPLICCKLVSAVSRVMQDVVPQVRCKACLLSSEMLQAAIICLVRLPAADAVPVKDAWPSILEIYTQCLQASVNDSVLSVRLHGIKMQERAVRLLLPSGGLVPVRHAVMAADKLRTQGTQLLQDITNKLSGSPNQLSVQEISVLLNSLVGIARDLPNQRPKVCAAVCGMAGLPAGQLRLRVKHMLRQALVSLLTFMESSQASQRQQLLAALQVIGVQNGDHAAKFASHFVGTKRVLNGAWEKQAKRPTLHELKELFTKNESASDLAEGALITLELPLPAVRPQGPGLDEDARKNLRALFSKEDNTAVVESMSRCTARLLEQPDVTSIGSSHLMSLLDLADMTSTREDKDSVETVTSRLVMSLSTATQQAFIDFISQDMSRRSDLVIKLLWQCVVAKPSQYESLFLKLLNAASCDTIEYWTPIMKRCPYLPPAVVTWVVDHFKSAPEWRHAAMVALSNCMTKPKIARVACKEIIELCTNADEDTRLAALKELETFLWKQAGSQQPLFNAVIADCQIGRDAEEADIERTAGALKVMVGLSPSMAITTAQVWSGLHPVARQSLLSSCAVLAKEFGVKRTGEMLQFLTAENSEFFTTLVNELVWESGLVIINKPPLPDALSLLCSNALERMQSCEGSAWNLSAPIIHLFDSQQLSSALPALLSQLSKDDVKRIARNLVKSSVHMPPIEGLITIHQCTDQAEILVPALSAAYAEIDVQDLSKAVSRMAEMRNPPLMYMHTIIRVAKDPAKREFACDTVRRLLVKGALKLQEQMDGVFAFVDKYWPATAGVIEALEADEVARLLDDNPDMMQKLQSFEAEGGTLPRNAEAAMQAKVAR